MVIYRIRSGVIIGGILVFVLNTNNAQRQFELTSTMISSQNQARETEIAASATAYAEASATQSP